MHLHTIFKNIYLMWDLQGGGRDLIISYLIVRWKEVKKSRLYKNLWTTVMIARCQILNLKNWFCSVYLYLSYYMLLQFHIMLYEYNYWFYIIPIYYIIYYNMIYVLRTLKIPTYLHITTYRYICIFFIGHQNICTFYDRPIKHRKIGHP